MAKLFRILVLAFGLSLPLAEAYAQEGGRGVGPEKLFTLQVIAEIGGRHSGLRTQKRA